MNNEIKETLKLLNDDEYNYISLDRKSCKLLLDYITNLQEENKELNDDNIWWNNRFKAAQRNYKDYKSRNKKAIEFIEENVGIIFNPFSKKYTSLDEMTKSGIGEIWYILQGSDKE